MKRFFLIGVMITSLLLITGCGKEEKKIVCKMNTAGSVFAEIVAKMDSNDKVSEIEIRTIYESEENAKNDFESFKLVHGDNAVIDKNVITVKNVHDANTLFGKQYSKTVGFTKEEFQTFLGNFICE